MEPGHGTSSGSRLQGLLGSVLGVASMEEEAACSIPISPEENDSGSDTTELARQLEFLRVHVASVPYECETVDEMNERLNHIIHMIYTTAKSNQIDLLEGWNHVLGLYINSLNRTISLTID